MIVIGLIGGVASGKSFAADCFEQLGAVRLDGDVAGHRVLEEPEVMDQARQRWGEAIFDVQGRIDRSRLARIVFGPSPEAVEELAFLESLSHPRIGNFLRNQLDQLRAQGKVQVAVVDAAMLLKAGWDDFCDKIVFVDCPEPLRRQRALARGWDEQQLSRREQSQQTLEQKRSRADYVIENSGTLEGFRQQIMHFWDSLLG